MLKIETLWSLKGRRRGAYRLVRNGLCFDFNHFTILEGVLRTDSSCRAEEDTDEKIEQIGADPLCDSGNFFNYYRITKSNCSKKVKKQKSMLNF